MNKIRVLVVDDSVVVRRVVSDVLAADPAIEVVGVAANGRIALAKIPQLAPDVMTLDVDMPEMSGLETLARVRKLHPGLLVIMFSTLTERGAAATLDALSMGADDYVTKPSNAGSVMVAMSRIRDALLPRIKALFPGTTGEEPVARQEPRKPTRAAECGARRAEAPVELLVIGASTGGPNALAGLLPRLPPAFPVPILIVQHMPPIFTKLFSERLAAVSRVRVKEGGDMEFLDPGSAWLAQGDLHMTVEREGRRGRIRTHKGAHVNSCRPSVDVLFASAASAYGAGVLGLVLTGMGRDGEEGSRRIREAGGQVLVQDEESSVVWGMPGSVYRAGCADEVVPLRDIPSALISRVHRSWRAPHALPAGGD